MTLTSPAFEPNSPIPTQYTCEGENVSPPLRFGDIPQSAQAVVLIVEDPDAVSKKPWIHWIVYNLDPRLAGMDEGSVPESGMLGMTDFGKAGYGGPCPPPGTGTHRYFFKLYALDSKLHFDVSPSAEELKAAMDGHIIDTAELVGLYQKSA